jgi:triosephosphate isomerase
MNAGTPAEARALALAVARAALDRDRVDVLVAPPFPVLAVVAEQLDAVDGKVWVGAQDMSAEVSGAFTGEVSPPPHPPPGATLAVVERQVRAAVAALARQPGFGAVAYEPVWAIGTGKVARPEDAQAVHAAIRALLGATSGALAEQTRLLYGGSVKADNAAALLGQPDIDGALVGGASLDGPGFGKIIEAAQGLAERGR